MCVYMYSVCMITNRQIITKPKGQPWRLTKLRSLLLLNGVGILP